MTVAGHPMHQTTVAKLESASRPTNVGEINAIASIFGVSMTALFDYSAEGQINLELAGLTTRLATISAEKARLEERVAALNTEYASVEALQRDLQERIDIEREIEEQLHRREDAGKFVILAKQDAYNVPAQHEATVDEFYGREGGR
jgi:hypothetical protein